MEIILIVAALYIVVAQTIPFVGYLTKLDYFIVTTFFILSFTVGIHFATRLLMESATHLPMNYFVKDLMDFIFRIIWLPLSIVTFWRFFELGNSFQTRSMIAVTLTLIAAFALTKFESLKWSLRYSIVLLLAKKEKIRLFDDKKDNYVHIFVYFWGILFFLYRLFFNFICCWSTDISKFDMVPTNINSTSIDNLKSDIECGEEKSDSNSNFSADELQQSESFDISEAKKELLQTEDNETIIIMQENPQVVVMPPTSANIGTKSSKKYVNLTKWEMNKSASSIDTASAKPKIFSGRNSSKRLSGLAKLNKMKKISMKVPVFRDNKSENSDVKATEHHIEHQHKKMSPNFSLHELAAAHLLIKGQKLTFFEKIVLEIARKYYGLSSIDDIKDIPCENKV
jgi:hypothetical protein